MCLKMGCVECGLEIIVILLYFFGTIHRYMIIHDCTVSHGIVVYVITIINIVMIIIIVIIIINF